MGMPNIWGQGQLFAFSALDGEALLGDDFSGILCGDKLGIRFFSRVCRELVITGFGDWEPEFTAVTGDYISLKTTRGEICVLYADKHLILGSTAGTARAVVTVEGDYTQEKIGEIQLHNTRDGAYTGLLTDGDRFFFAYGHSPQEVEARITGGRGMSLEALQEKKRNIYAAPSPADGGPYDRLWGKCVSVMRTQLLSPEGKLRRVWSTPDRLPHRYFWLWDSVFHAIGQRNLDANLAQELLLAIFDTQMPDGFIPHMTKANSREMSEFTQPPIIAWGAWLVYQKSGDRAFLRQVYERNQRFLTWCHENRRDTEAYLYTWKTSEERRCRCGESGMDNSPRFDRNTRLAAVDFCSYMANDVRFMARIADVLGDTEGERHYTGWFGRIRESVNRTLWCEEDGFYYDFDWNAKQLHKICSVASFLPLFAGICRPEQAGHLVLELRNPDTFDTPMGVPSISRQDPFYGTDMWRGPVWLNFNYMLICGLEEYGFDTVAEKLRKETLDAVNEWYLKTGVIFEFYDPENRVAPSKLNRKGLPFEPYNMTVRVQTIRDYGWSANLILDMLNVPFSGEAFSKGSQRKKTDLA